MVDTDGGKLRKVGYERLQFHIRVYNQTMGDWHDYVVGRCNNRKEK